MPGSVLLCLGAWKYQPCQRSRAKRAWQLSGCLVFFWTHRQYYDFEFSSLQGHKRSTLLNFTGHSWSPDCLSSPSVLLSLFPEHWHYVSEVCEVLRLKKELWCATKRHLLHHSETWVDVHRLKFRKGIWRSKGHYTKTGRLRSSYSPTSLGSFHEIIFLCFLHYLFHLSSSKGCRGTASPGSKTSRHSWKCILRCLWAVWCDKSVGNEKSMSLGPRGPFSVSASAT